MTKIQDPSWEGIKNYIQFIASTPPQVQTLAVQHFVEYLAQIASSRGECFSEEMREKIKNHYEIMEKNRKLQPIDLDQYNILF